MIRAGYNLITWCEAFTVINLFFNSCSINFDGSSAIRNPSISPFPLTSFTIFGNLPIILLSISSQEDYLFVAYAVTRTDEYGAITDLGISFSEDWGLISSGIGGSLQLGPLKRQVDRQKFNKEGGFSKSVYKQGGSGYTSGTVSVVVDPPPSGTTAVLTPIIGSSTTSTGTVTGAITGFTVTTAGTGYTFPPAITITDSGSGTGARAKAITSGTSASAQPITGAYLLQESHTSTTRSGTTVLSTSFEDIGGGYTVENFKDEQILTYAINFAEKTRIVMNSDITLV